MKVHLPWSNCKRSRKAQTEPKKTIVKSSKDEVYGNIAFGLFKLAQVCLIVGGFKVVFAGWYVILNAGNMDLTFLFDRIGRLGFVCLAIGCSAAATGLLFKNLAKQQNGIPNL